MYDMRDEFVAFRFISGIRDWSVFFIITSSTGYARRLTCCACVRISSHHQLCQYIKQIISCQAVSMTREYDTDSLIFHNINAAQIGLSSVTNNSKGVPNMGALHKVLSFVKDTLLELVNTVMLCQLQTSLPWFVQKTSELRSLSSKCP